MSDKDNDTPNGELTIRTLAMPKDTNPHGDIFGGDLPTLNAGRTQATNPRFDRFASVFDDGGSDVVGGCRGTGGESAPRVCLETAFAIIHDDVLRAALVRAPRSVRAVVLIRADFAAAAAAEVLAPVGVHGSDPSGTKRRRGVGSCVGREGDDDEK